MINLTAIYTYQIYDTIIFTLKIKNEEFFYIIIFHISYIVNYSSRFSGKSLLQDKNNNGFWFMG